MSEHSEIRNTEMSDLDFVFSLFEHSIVYQEARGYPVWKHYDKQAIIKDIKDKNQYKVIVDSQIAIVFSVCYTDKVIWREMDLGNSIYLHRIVVNPEFKGRKLFSKILDWSVDHATHRGCDSIRMDTWAANPTIINYYKTFGFVFIENYTTPDTDELPAHNRNLALSLLEFKIKDDV